MDIKSLAVRTISGIIYCGIIVGCILLGEYGVLVLSCLLAVTACLEFSKIDHELNTNTIPVLLLDMAGCVALSLAFLGFPLIIWVGIMIARMIEELYINSDKHLRNLAFSMMSQIYIGVPMGLLSGIAFILHPMLVLAIFIFIWINDTGAFLVGCTIGKHRLFERVSPKKSWEGFFGGLIFTVIAAICFSLWCSDFFGMNTFRAGIWEWIGFALVVSVFGTFGDLVESLLKRSLNIKDSGHIIPGHGGILDRIDSLLLAVPAAVIYFCFLWALC